MKGTLDVVPVDVSHFDSIRALSEQLDPILGAVGLDSLVNNAGIATSLVTSLALI
ncbi:hypothetical protein C8Q78DRAFT_1055422 [Trametes maxima]|nr:hypothetical protein C8Q78DRAFT_1055422 [Trametes maxima]